MSDDSPGLTVLEVRDSLKRVLFGDDHSWVLIVIAIGWLFALGTRLTIPAVLPQIKTDFGIDNTTAGLAVTSLWFAYAVTQFPAGALLDRYNERSILIAGAVTGAVGVGLFTVTPLLPVFLFACVLFGIGTGLYAPPRVTLLSKLFPDDDNTVLGLTWSAGNIGAVVLPVLASVVTARFGWRMGIGVLFPFFLIVLVGLYRVVPHRQQFRDAETSDGTAGTGLRVLTELGNRPVLMAGAGMALVIFVFQSISTFLPTYLIETKGYSQRVAVLLYGLFLSTGIVFQPVAGVFADAFGYKRILVAIGIFSTVTLAALPVTNSPLVLIILLPLIGVRRAIGPVGNAYLVSEIADEVQGSSYGLVRTFVLSFGSTGSTVTGALIDRGRADSAFLLLAGLTGVVSVLFVFLPRASDRE